MNKWAIAFFVIHIFGLLVPPLAMWLAIRSLYASGLTGGWFFSAVFGTILSGVASAYSVITCWGYLYAVIKRLAFETPPNSNGRS